MHLRGSTWPIGKMCRGINIHSYTNWQDTECFLFLLGRLVTVLDCLKVIIIVTVQRPRPAVYDATLAERWASGYPGDIYIIHCCNKKCSKYTYLSIHITD